MTVDAAAQAVAPDDAVLGDAGWRSIVGLAAAVVAVLVGFCIGVLLPYVVDDLHRVPLAEVAGGGHDPKDLWPQDGWAGPVGLVGLLTVAFGPLVLLAVQVVGAVWLTSLWRRRPEPDRVSRSLALVVVLAACAAALLFWFSEQGLALAAWRRD